VVTAAFGDVVFMDDFNRSDGPANHAWVTAGLGNSAITNNELRMVTGRVAGREWVLQDLIDIGQGLDGPLSDAPSTVEWRVAFTSSRDGLGGFDGGSYALALVMAASTSALTDSGTEGVAVLLGNPQSPDPLRLQHFTDGLGSNSALGTNVSPLIATWDGGSGEFDGNEFFTVRVTYSPVSGTWMLMADTNAATWPVAGPAQVIAAGVWPSTNTLSKCGLFFNHSSGDHFARWDNFAIRLLAREPAQARELEVDAVNENDADLLWTPGDGSGRLLAMRAGAPVDALPEPGRAYTANRIFGSGDALGNGTYVVAAGDVTDENIGGLVPATTYHLRLFEYARLAGDPDTTYYAITDSVGAVTRFTTAGTAADTTSILEPPFAPLTGGLLSALATNLSDTRALFSLRLTDSGDGDGLPTDVAQLVVVPGPSNTVDWTDSLAGLTFSNLVTGMQVPILSTQVTDSDITFTFPPGGLVMDEGSDGEIQLLARPQPGGVRDGGALMFQILPTGHGAVARPGGSQFTNTFLAAIESPLWTFGVTATRLGFIRPPERVLVKRPFALAVEAWDIAGNVDVDVNGPALLVASPEAPLQAAQAVVLVQGRGQAASLRAIRPGVFTLEAQFAGLLHAQSGPITAGEGLKTGAIGVVGLQNNASNGPDSFAFATLDWLPAGTVIYFTDNGWGDAGFRGVSETDGNGAEGVTAFTAVSELAPGTLVTSYETNPAYAWATNGPIPGAQSGTWGDLGFSQEGDQLTAFISATSTNPLYSSGPRPLFQFDYTDGFEVAESSSTGDLVPGSQRDRHAVTLPNAPVWTLHLDGHARSRDAWLAYMTDPANWISGSEGPLPSGVLEVLAPTGVLLMVW
jgi:hypothetical protein